MKLLLKHLKNNRDALLQFSQLVAIADHSVNLGTARESLISNFIQTNLPEYIKYHSGEIFDRWDRRSGQIDIILHPITSPKLYLQNTVSIFPAETVLAAIEVKTNLTTGNGTGALFEALKSCRKLKELEIIQDKSPSDPIVDSCRVPFIIFAFKGPTIETLREKLGDFFGRDDVNARMLPDMIVVLDGGYYLSKISAWMNAGLTIQTLYNESTDSDSVLLGLFELILKLVEDWSANPSQHVMPIEAYTKQLDNSLFKLMKKLT